MGQMEFNSRFYQNITITRDSFQFLTVIGRGSFGKVWKAQFKKSKKILAIKEMSKLKILQKRMHANILTERDILKAFHNPFIVNMYCTFQDKDYCYIVLDFLNGGDLRYRHLLQKKFDNDQIKFILACIVISWEFIHSQGVIHRDVKPENLVIDSEGFVRLTDFGLAKIVNNKIAYHDPSGTPGYISPETVSNGESFYTSDYFSLGVIAYELLNGVLPFTAVWKDEMKIEHEKTKICLTENDVRKGINPDIASLINSLLAVQPKFRLGYKGINEIKNHKYFASINWNEFKKKKVISLFLPKYGTSVSEEDYKRIGNVEEYVDYSYDITELDEHHQKKFEHYGYFDFMAKYIQWKPMIFTGSHSFGRKEMIHWKWNTNWSTGLMLGTSANTCKNRGISDKIRNLCLMNSEKGKWRSSKNTIDVGSDNINSEVNSPQRKTILQMSGRKSEEFKKRFTTKFSICDTQSVLKNNSGNTSVKGIEGNKPRKNVFLKTQKFKSNSQLTTYKTLYELNLDHKSNNEGLKINSEINLPLIRGVKTVSPMKIKKGSESTKKMSFNLTNTSYKNTTMSKTSIFKLAE